MRSIKFNLVWLVVMGSMALASFSVFAQAPNPTSFRADPTYIIIPGQIRYCADGGANMTVDLRYTYRRDIDEQDQSAESTVSMDSSGCLMATYSDISFSGRYRFTAIRNALNRPNGPWLNIDVTVTLRRPAPNPTSFRANPIEIVIPGQIVYCAGGAANMTVDLAYTYRLDSNEQDQSTESTVTLDSSGCYRATYSDPGFSGRYRFTALRNALNRPNGPWLNLTPSVEVTLRRPDLVCPSMCSVQVYNPPPNTTYYITADPFPPQMNANVRIDGANPDPTPTTRFLWDTEFHYRPDPRADPIVATLDTQETTGGNFTLDYYPWDAGVIGGNLTLRAEARLARAIPGTNTNAKVIGTNPGTGPIHQWITDLVADDNLRFSLIRIACHESGGPGAGPRQFRAAREGGQGWPLWGYPNGYGIMQKDPPNDAYDAWDWKINIVSGIDEFYAKRREAQNMHLRERTELNQERGPGNGCPPNWPPPLSDTLLEGGVTQLNREAIRRYNCGREHKWMPRDAPNCAGQWVIIDHKTDPLYQQQCPRWREVYNYVGRVLECQN